MIGRKVQGVRATRYREYGESSLGDVGCLTYNLEWR
jgi:hypothetical protein